MNFLSAAGWSAWNVGRMRSASRAGSVFASHNPQAGPMMALTTRNTHAAGQSSVPRGCANSKRAERDDEDGVLQQKFCDHAAGSIRP